MLGGELAGTAEDGGSVPAVLGWLVVGAVAPLGVVEGLVAVAVSCPELSGHGGCGDHAAGMAAL